MKRASLKDCVDTVIYLEGNSDYTTVYFSDRKPVLFAYPLVRFAEDIPLLVRTHKKYLVNPHYVEDFPWKGSLAAHVVVGDRQLPVSRRRVKAVYTALQLFSHQIVKSGLSTALTNNPVVDQDATLRLNHKSGTPVGQSNHQGTRHPINIFDEMLLED